VNNELERIWKEAVVALRYYPNICVEELRNSIKTVSQDNRSSGSDLNPGPLEYEEVLITRL
jgi:hypothetical protein